MQFLKRIYSEWGSGVTGTLSAPLFIASFALSGLPRYILAGFAVLCIYIAAARVWRVEYDKRIVAESRLHVDTNGPVLVVELPEPKLHKIFGDEHVILLRNIGHRAATRVYIASVEAGPYRFVFTEINAIAQAGSRGDTVPVAYDVYKGEVPFSSTSNPRPANGLVHALEHEKGLLDKSEIKLKIIFSDSGLFKSTTQVISYDQWNNTARIYGEDCSS
jgi:hypothetical protein